MKIEGIINIAVIAHVDAGKSTLVDAFLNQSNVFRANEVVPDCVMDSNDLERERGITIYSKNCSILYKNHKINIVDTPGHADFSSEVERIMKTVDTVILLVDSSEGPMPQTRFVLQKSLEAGHRPILFINKIDKKDQRAEEVVNLAFDLFVELGATDEQLDFPILYGVAKAGIAQKELSDEGKDLSPLFETILEHVDPYGASSTDPLQLQISSLDYDDYIGRLGIGRVIRGTLSQGDQVGISKRDGKLEKGRVGKVFVYEGLQRKEVAKAQAGDMVIVSGLNDISIGETLCHPDHMEPLPIHKIEEPTLSMNFLINDSPFCGKSGKFVTNRHLKNRLDKELEVNVGLKVEPLDSVQDGFKVSGRGELHLSILLENMRREGYEVAVSKPQVLFRMVDGIRMEPIEKVVAITPDDYSGTVISELSIRKGTLETMQSEDGYTRMEFKVPTRGLLGYRSEFVNVTRGEGILLRSFYGYEPYRGDIPRRNNGVLISQQGGTAMAYSIFNLSDRAVMMIDPGTDVYEGMIVGINSRKEDMTVNPTKNKKLTNTRASGSDDAIKLNAAKAFNLEEALTFIEDDELLEITPDALRLRKRILNETDRVRERNRLGKMASGD
ncbi:translational GTPase TypA [Fusibacter tunisiensis]|uniref:Large ribosomal subunit assembly factor BipA n=1 Tax=Fusibacter tunisiensis TaxID=1008308 RepID=A0ABS2MRA3_9FIRM|nr:translational GTPase TypA [Fusibacter tunisiensis]MBM7561958.1 GTP-binding protein [Fusibacter tunisiensis]